MNPLDEYFFCKEAGFWGSIAKGFKSPEFRGAATNLGVAAGAMVAAPAAQKLMGAITKRRDFNRMMEVNPGLKEEQQMNPTGFNQMYSSLRRMNPDFARDPIVAGGLMFRMGDDPEAAASILQESYRARREPSQSPMTRTLVNAASRAASDPLSAQRQRVEQMGLDIKEHELGQKQRAIGEAQKQMRLPGT